MPHPPVGVGLFSYGCVCDLRDYLASSRVYLGYLVGTLCGRKIKSAFHGGCDLTCHGGGARQPANFIPITIILFIYISIEITYTMGYNICTPNTLCRTRCARIRQHRYSQRFVAPNEDKSQLCKQSALLGFLLLISLYIYSIIHIHSSIY